MLHTQRSRTTRTIGVALGVAWVVSGCPAPEIAPDAEAPAHTSTADVAAPPPSPGAPSDTLSPILAGIASAREDIARGDAIDAQFALDAPRELLFEIAKPSAADSAPVLDRPAEPGGRVDESIRLFAAYRWIEEARRHLDAADLAAADAALVEALAAVRTAPE